MLTSISALLASESPDLSPANFQDTCVAVISALKIVDCDEFVGQIACRVLIKLIMLNNALILRIIESDTVESIFCLIQKSKDNEVLVEVVASCIARICTADRQAAYRVMACSGCEAIIQCLSTQVNSVKVAIQCCSAIETLCSECDVISRLVSSGAAEAILKALKKHPAETHLQEQGCAALAMLCSGTSPLAREKLSATQTCESTALLLQTAPRNSIVMEHILSVMTCLATMGPDNPNRLTGTGSCSTIIAVMDQFINDAKVIKQGLGAINAIALNNQSLMSYFFLANVTDLLANIFKIYHDNPIIISRACAAVACLGHSANSEYQEAMASAGLCQAILKSLKFYFENKDVAKQAVEAIMVLSNSGCALTLQLLTDLEVKTVLQQAVTHYPEIRDVALPAVWAQVLLERY